MKYISIKGVIMFELNPQQELLILKRLTKRHKVSISEAERVLSKVRVTILQKQTDKLKLEVERDLFNYHAPIINELLKEIE